jgi:membrane protease YdiL (CAAX protease family)
MLENSPPVPPPDNAADPDVAPDDLLDRPGGWPPSQKPAFSESLAWAVFLCLLATSFWLNATPAAVETVRVDREQQLELRLQSRYLLGTDQILHAVPGAEQQRQQLASSASDLQWPREQALCAVPLFRGLGDAARGTDILEQTPAASDPVEEDLRALLAEPPVLPPDEKRPAIVERCGFLGELALANATPDAGDERVLLESARTFALLLLAGMAGALVALLLGFVLGGLALLRLRDGKLQPAYARAIERLPAADRRPAARVPYLETGSVFLTLLFTLGILAAIASDGVGSFWPMLLNWLVLPATLWPLARGKQWPELRLALGWHRGKGIAREIGSGIVAYLAAAPLLFAGLMLTVALSQLADEQPYHPLLDWVREASPAGLAIAFLLAVVWAPLCEESIFRGALYHYGRGRLGALGAGLAVALVFAAIHPQGLAGIPFLAALALALALAREWRGSLIASMTMHLLHNLAVFLFMLLALR